MIFRSLPIVLLSLSATTFVRAEGEPSAAAKKLTIEPSVEKAKVAGDRARALPADDRVRLGKLLEELAALWERVTSELTRTRNLEKAADQKEEELVKLGARTERALLLIEQTEARRARALARLKELEGTQGQ